MKKRLTRTNQPKVNPDESQRSLNTSNGRWHIIARKAYELYEQRGHIDGHALEDWLRAEALLSDATD